MNSDYDQAHLDLGCDAALERIAERNKDARAIDQRIADHLNALGWRTEEARHMLKSALFIEYCKVRRNQEIEESFWDYVARTI